MDLESLLRKYKLPLLIGLVGTVFFVFGALLLLTGKDRPQIEIISSPPTAETKIWVDIEGAVQQPGIYELPGDARINDLLAAAGGLSASADRDWLAQNLNLAQKLIDGSKIYLPSRQEIAQFGGPGLGNQPATSLININIASNTQLTSLPGIGDKRAADIAENRPYLKLEELITKAKIPKNVFENIKKLITI